jgi:hypothetical protein
MSLTKQTRDAADDPSTPAMEYVFRAKDFRWHGLRMLVSVPLIRTLGSDREATKLDCVRAFATKQPELYGCLDSVAEVLNKTNLGPDSLRGEVQMKVGGRPVLVLARAVALPFSPESGEEYVLALDILPWTDADPAQRGLT